MLKIHQFTANITHSHEARNRKLDRLAAAFTTENDITIHAEHSPIEFASHLLHEGGHVLDNNDIFTKRKILHPDDIFAKTIDLNAARRRLLVELFSTNQPIENWYGEVIETIYQILDISQRDHSI